LAQDAINRWNAQNQIDVAKYNNSVNQGSFENQLALTSAKANAINGVANATDTQALRKQQNANEYGQILQQGANNTAGMMVKGS
jgi:hypothetical protein